MSDDDTVIDAEPTDDERERGRIEFMAAILLGFAGLLTAYAAYYGALAGGDALKGYTQSQRTLQDANAFYNDTLGYFNQDQSVFLQYQIKLEEGADDIAEVIRGPCSPTALETAYADLGTSCPSTTRRLAARPARVRDRRRKASPTISTIRPEAEFDDAQEIDDQGDNMTLRPSSSPCRCFFAGVAGLLKTPKMSLHPARHERAPHRPRRAGPSARARPWWSTWPQSADARLQGRVPGSCGCRC